MSTPSRGARPACLALALAFAPTAWAAPETAGPTPLVEDAWTADRPLAREHRIAMVDGELVVAVSGLATVLTDTPCEDLRLVLDEQPLAGPAPRACDAGEVRFALAAVDRAADPAWRRMATARPETRVPIGRARVTLAGIGGVPLPTRVKGDAALRFELATGPSLLVGGAAVLAVLLGLLGLGRWTPALRDPRARGPVSARPYSLSRVQLAWWTVLVLGGFLLSTSLNGQAAPVPTSVLALLGVGVGTVAGERVVDADAAPPPESRGLFRDLISDPAGRVALGGFQAVVWTAVIGGVFVHGVVSTGAIPDLDASLVALMGMTAGAYVGLKATGERPGPEPAPPD